jgi:hypothetical protein
MRMHADRNGETEVHPNQVGVLEEGFCASWAHTWNEIAITRYPETQTASYRQRIGKSDVLHQSSSQPNKAGMAKSNVYKNSDQ